MGGPFWLFFSVGKEKRKQPGRSFGVFCYLKKKSKSLIFFFVRRYGGRAFYLIFFVLFVLSPGIGEDWAKGEELKSFFVLVERGLQGG